MKRLLLVILLVIVASACQGHISKGTVIGKQHYDAYDSTTMMPMYGYREQCFGKTCTMVPYIISYYPVTDHHPEQWIVTIHGCEDDHPDNCRDEQWSVSEEWYNQIVYGQVIERSN